MFKVFLVEDEFALRERMKRNIPWEENELQLVGEAGDGELAYPMILESQPDIIITDIRMPFMDGLALSKLVRQNRPLVKIIILSGYDEFEYAKEAINIGVTDYLLKPITPKQLLESLKRVTTVIEKEQAQERSLEKYQKDEKEEKKKRRSEFFNQLTTCYLESSDIFVRAKELEINLIGSTYNMILAKLILEGKGLAKYKELNQEIEHAVWDWCSTRQDVIFFNRELEGLAFIVKGSSDEIRDLEKAVIKMLQEKFEAQQIEHYCIGIGESVMRASGLRVSFESANKALAYRYIMREKRVIFYDQLEEYRLIPQEEKMSIKNIDISRFDKKIVIDFLKSGVVTQIETFVHKYLKESGGSASLLFREYMIMDIYLSAIQFIEELGQKTDGFIEACGDIRSIHEQIQSQERTCIYLERILKYVLLLRDEVASNRYNTVLEAAKAYIADNYNQEDISLNSVAEHVGISPSHFSTIFSQKMGQTFISYLTEIRMKKAKELLRCSNMKSFEIGFAVGYKDPHYFSYLFKKTQDCTPKEYRNYKENL